MRNQRSAAARKGWQTRKRNQRSAAARKGWQTRKRNQRSAAARKGWQTRKRNQRKITKQTYIIHLEYGGGKGAPIRFQMQMTGPASHRDEMVWDVARKFERTGKLAKGYKFESIEWNRQADLEIDGEDEEGRPSIESENPIIQHLKSLTFQGGEATVDRIKSRKDRSSKK